MNFEKYRISFVLFCISFIMSIFIIKMGLSIKNDLIAVSFFYYIIIPLNVFFVISLPVIGLFYNSTEFKKIIRYSVFIFFLLSSIVAIIGISYSHYKDYISIIGGYFSHIILFYPILFILLVIIRIKLKLKSKLSK